MKAPSFSLSLTPSPSLSFSGRVVGRNSLFVVPLCRARKIRSGTPYSRWLTASLPYFAILPTTRRTRDYNGVGESSSTSESMFSPIAEFRGMNFSMYHNGERRETSNDISPRYIVARVYVKMRILFKLFPVLSLTLSPSSPRLCSIKRSYHFHASNGVSIIS